MNIYNLFFKRFLDFSLSLILFVLLLPFFLLICLLIQIDSGYPYIYRQSRCGLYGKEFKIFKFRTMVINADSIGSTSTIKGDARITNIGKILRRFSIDELPQLLNVVLGDMSLIGYRPGIKANYSKEFLSSSVFNTRPGITGLAQVSGRSALTSEDKRKLEIKYAQNISFVNDLKIYFATVSKVFFGKDAF